jgi:hypothetical protein
MWQQIKSGECDEMLRIEHVCCDIEYLRWMPDGLQREAKRDLGLPEGPRICDRVIHDNSTV